MVKRSFNGNGDGLWHWVLPHSPLQIRLAFPGPQRCGAARCYGDAMLRHRQGPERGLWHPMALEVVEPWRAPPGAAKIWPMGAGSHRRWDVSYRCGSAWCLMMLNADVVIGDERWWKYHLANLLFLKCRMKDLWARFGSAQWVFGCQIMPGGSPREGGYTFKKLDESSGLLLDGGEEVGR